MTSLQHYPAANVEILRKAFVGQRLSSPAIPTPSLVLDRAVVRRNCDLMLQTVEELGVKWRAHVKTHKTTELTQLQVGDNPKQSVRLVVSTVAEVENVALWLQQCITQGRKVDVLYGLAISQSAIPRLASVARMLGPETVGVFVDHPAHIEFLEKVDESTWPGQIPIYVNIDVGYHREGVEAESKQLSQIAVALRKAQRVVLHGVYTHHGSSYGAGSPEEALKYMRDELEGLEAGAVAFMRHVEGAEGPATGTPNARKLVLSLGATPTITSAQNLLEQNAMAKEYRDTINRINQKFEVEFHAGVYPVLDMQQLATRARPLRSASAQGGSLLSFSDIGARTLVEVTSLYLNRSEKPEALIAAGSLALGREPCKSYPGWGIISPWPAGEDGSFYDPEGSQTGWIVGRVMQEHGILTWEGPQDNIRELQVGEKLLVWPNHACIAGSHFGWYLVVDSESSDPERVVDVWVRWRGW